MMYTLVSKAKFTGNIKSLMLNSARSEYYALPKLLENLKCSPAYDECEGLYCDINELISDHFGDGFRISSSEAVDLVEWVLKNRGIKTVDGYYKETCTGVKCLTFNQFLKEILKQIKGHLEDGKEYEISELTQYIEGLIDETEYQEFFKGVIEDSNPNGVLAF